MVICSLLRTVANTRKYTKELLEPVVKQATSLAEVLRKLDLKLTGGNYRNISSWIRFHKIPIQHFTGSAWNKGKTVETDSRIARIGYTDEEVFTTNAPSIGGPKLKKRLIRLGWEYACKRCGIKDWRGEPITLHLDHINGIRNDNRLENLRFLCPNCHQQTETWGFKKSK